MTTDKQKIEEDGEGVPAVTTSAIEPNIPRIHKKDVRKFKRKAKSSFKDFYKAGVGR